MTKYRVHRIDRIITGAYTGPLAKRYCAALRHALTLMWTVMTLSNALDAFRPNHFILLVDRWAESGILDRMSSCVAVTAPMITTIRRKQTMNNQQRLRLYGHLEQ